MNFSRLSRCALALTLLAAAVMLTGCDTAAAAPTDPPAETVVQATEPEPVPLPGAVVTVDGKHLESGSLIFDGTACIRPEELFQAIGEGNCSPVGKNSIMVEFRSVHYIFIASSSVVMVEGEEISLYDPAVLYQGTLWVPLERLCDLLEISLLEDPTHNQVYCTSTIPTGEIPEGIRVPVLMYHAVDSNVWGYRDLFVSPEVMEQHIVYLVENGYDLIHFEDLDELDQYDKPVILTFDDGYLDNYTNLYPLLQKYGVKATIFVVTSSMGKYATSMTPEQVKELSDSALVSIQSHTVSHRVLAGQDAQSQEAEMERSRLYVARMTGREPFVISYPTGAYNDDTLSLSTIYYRFAVTVEPGDYVTGSDPGTICRYNVRHTTTLEELAQMVAHAGEQILPEETVPAPEMTAP